jgi:hypothetical protein
MSAGPKIARTFTLERDLLQLVERTKGKVSASARVNELLKAGLEAERRRGLEREAAEFFHTEPDDPAERAAFRASSIKSLSRE